MSQVIGLDGARRKAGLDAAVVPANTQSAVQIEGHVPQMAGRSGSSAKDHAIHQHRAPNAGAKGQQNDIALSACRSPTGLPQPARCARRCRRRPANRRPRSHPPGVVLPENTGLRAGCSRGKLRCRSRLCSRCRFRAPAVCARFKTECTKSCSAAGVRGDGSRKLSMSFPSSPTSAALMAVAPMSTPTAIAASE